MNDLIITNQNIRDLIWAIKSNNIIAENHFNFSLFDNSIYKTEYISILEHIKKLNSDYNLLNTFNKTVQHKLIGKYFENLIAYFFTISERFELLYRNITIQEYNKTIGEIDFIVFDNLNKEYIHIETVGKFFLWNGINENLASFVGPNPKDSLDKKISRIISHQIPLISKSITKSKLKELKLPTNLKSKIIFKGYIFYPFQFFNSIPSLPFINHDSSFGYWILEDQINQLKLISENWVIIDRKNWVGIYSTNRIPLTIAELQTEVIKILKLKSYPVLIVKVNKIDNYFIETDRFFVLPNDFFITSS